MELQHARPRKGESVTTNPTGATGATSEGSEGGVKELRLALVCYGGVSLSVYMHGLTQELHRIVSASNDLLAGQRPDGAAGVYYDMLAALERRDGVKTRAIIDVISGTSAGGINGVSLARALAQGGNLEPIRKLWLEHADIGTLLQPGWPKLVFDAWPWLEQHTPIGRWLGIPPDLPGEHHKRFLDGLRRKGREIEDIFHMRDKIPSVLHGDQLSAYLADGLRQIAQGDNRQSLIPQGHLLELFVTMTDLNGYVQHVPLGNRYAIERSHRHFNTFSYYEPAKGDGRLARNDFADGYVSMLAFSARASSSFPAAFEPVSLDSFAADVRRCTQPADWTRDRGQIGTFFRRYALNWRDTHEGETDDQVTATAIRARRFVDGGVLDNYPFDHAIDAIRARQAQHQVHRVLIYLEPDPMKPVLDELAVPDEAPSIIRALAAAGNGIPLSETILEQVQRIDEMNSAARRLKHITDQINFAAVQPDDTVAWTLQDAPYLRLRLDGVATNMGNAVCRICDFPSGSNQAAATHQIADDWVAAKLGDPAAQNAVELGTGAHELLSAFDVDFHKRRLRFVIDGIIGLYAGLKPGSTPDRTQLDGAKRLLYHGRARFDMAYQTILTSQEPEDVELRARVRLLFPDSISREMLGRPDDASTGVDTAPASAGDAREQEIEAVLYDVNGRLLQLLGAESLEIVSVAVFAEFKAMVKSWGVTHGVKADLEARFTAFVSWDRILYAIGKVYRVGESDVIELARMSPRDAYVLAPPASAPAEERRAFYDGKLNGVVMHHFGAFLERPWRENDYLWGRLDGAERLARVAFGNADASDAEVRDWALKLFAAILAEERNADPPLSAATLEPFEQRLALRSGSLV